MYKQALRISSLLSLLPSAALAHTGSSEHPESSIMQHIFAHPEFFALTILVSLILLKNYTYDAQ